MSESKLERIGAAIDATWQKAAVALCQEVADLNGAGAPIPKDTLLNLDRATRHVHRMLAAERDADGDAKTIDVDPEDPLAGLRLIGENVA